MIEKLGDALGRALKWYWYGFLTHFLAYLPLPLILVLLLAMLSGILGEGMGVDKIVWEDDPLRQFVVGVSLVFVVAETLFVGYMLWLRDRRSSALLAETCGARYGGYCWSIVACLAATGGMIAGVTWLMNQVLNSARQAPLADPDRLSYAVPWLLLGAVLLGGFGCWLLGRGSVALRLSRAFRAAPGSPRARPRQRWRFFARRTAFRLLCRCLPLAFLLLWGVLLVWLDRTNPGLLLESRSPPHPWLLVLGCVAGGLVVAGVSAWADWALRLLELLMGRAGRGAPISRMFRDEAERFRARLCDYAAGRDEESLYGVRLLFIPVVWTGWGYLFGMAMPKESPPAGWTVLLFLGVGLAAWSCLLSAGGRARQFRRYAATLAAPAGWVVFGYLVAPAWAGGAPAGWGVFAVFVGIVVTATAWAVPGSISFGLCLLANSAALIAAVTFVTSKFALTDWSLVFVYPLAPLSLAFLGWVLTVYAPAGAAAFFGQGAAPGPDPRSAEAWNRWRAALVVLAGWSFFVAVGSCPVLASPVPLVCTLLFVVVALYGFLAYSVRGSLAPLAGLLLLLVVLSGINLYKFRFPDALDRYAATPEGSDAAVLPLDNLPDRDEFTFKQARRVLLEFLQARKDFENHTLEVRKLEAAKAEEETRSDPPAGPNDSLADLERQLAKAREHRDAAAEKTRLLLPEAATTFATVRQDSRLLRIPFSSELTPLFEENRLFAEGLLRLPQKSLSSKHGLLTTEQVRWREGGRLGGGPVPGQVKKPLILIAVSGGGLRSAAWTHLMLRELEQAFEEQGKDFPAHVRVITGASGGMLGASYYVTSLDPPARRKTGCDRQRELEDQFRALTRDAITPLMRQLVFEDVPNFFSPWPTSHDRGKTLEQTWRSHLDGRLEMNFGELRAGEEAGWRPSLVLTPMMIEDGRRLIISNLDLQHAVNNRGSLFEPRSATKLLEDLEARGVETESAKELLREHPPEDIDVQIQAFDWRQRRGESPHHGCFPAGPALADAIRFGDPLPADFFPWDDGTYSIEAVELFRLFPTAATRFRVATGVRMSASFPFFTPAVPLPTRPRRRVVDAGYYDNYGISFATAWLFSNRNARWLRENASQVCLIQIRDGLSDRYRRLAEVKKDSTSEISRGIEELLSPLEGLDNARVSSSSFRNDGQLELYTLYNKQPSADGTRIPFLVVNLEYAGQAALNWRLARREIEDLQAKAHNDEIQRRIRGLVRTLYPPPVDLPAD